MHKQVTLGVIALGEYTSASGAYAVAMGDGASASGDSSVALGAGASANGELSLATGTATQANGMLSFASGYGTRAEDIFTIALGSFNTVKTNPLQTYRYLPIHYLLLVTVLLQNAPMPLKFYLMAQPLLQETSTSTQMHV